MELAWLHYIPLLPLIGAVICGLAGRWLPRAWVATVALLAVLLPFCLGLTAFNLIAHEEGVRLHELVYNWFTVGMLHVDVGLTIDRLSGTLVLIITGVGFLIHLYSAAYMEEDPGFWRYFAYLNLFVSAMLLLVLGDNMVAMFVGWEGVGLCSYLLIGFWFTDDAKAYAGRKAFVVNRIGDFGFLLGMFVLYNTTGTLSFGQLAVLPLGLGVASLAGALLFVGATGKSAQLPLYIWLPDAMAGPTPVSALIHAATMVTAGVYMIARLSNLYVQAPGVMLVIAVVGGLTALWAAMIATVQTDIKRVLAYSTVSQLGYMFVGVGVGAFFAGSMHLITHAFFKACLFLGSGAVIHGLHGEQDMRKMGGLRKHMPHTAWTFLIATIAITGVLPISGFFSKDEILGQAFRTNVFSNLTMGPPSGPFAFLNGYHCGWVGPLVWVIGTITALLTAFYMWRCYFLTFEGEYRGPADVHPHESPWAMTVPLWILAALSVGALVLGLPEAWVKGSPWLSHLRWEAFTEGVFSKPPVEPREVNELIFYLIAIIIALVGFSIAWTHFLAEGWQERAEGVKQRLGGLHRALTNKLYVDELYGLLFVKPLWSGARWLWRLVDSMLIDGLFVNGSAQLVAAVGSMGRKFQNGDVQRYAAVTAVGVAALIYVFLLRG